MALAADDFRKVAPIDWTRIARACDFYSKKGYSYVEVPWAVSRETADLTMPPTAVPMHVSNSDAVMIGSAEQGLLAVMPNVSFEEFKPGKLLFAVSPCFRPEPNLLGGVTQLTFMKVELFSIVERGNYKQRKEAGVFEGIEDILLDDANEFMSSEGATVTRVSTEQGTDLYCGDVEVGSYGSRTSEEEPRYKWAYGTGLAEPRFSTALRLQNSDRQLFFHLGSYGKRHPYGAWRGRP